MNKKQQRTQDVIDHFRGLPGEFYMLKSLLVLPTGIENGESKRGGYWAGVKVRKQVNALYDGLMIAKRMDEMTGLNVAELKAAS